MNSRKTIIVLLIFILSCLTVNFSRADDTCTFMATANDIPPDIVILLDNGAEMEQIVWNTNFNNSTDYTPHSSAVHADVVQGNGTGNGFYLPNGYSIILSGSKYYLVDIPGDLKVADHAYSLMADGDGSKPVWTINGHTITLPAVPSSKVDANGIKDNATNFRYSTNYLNWLFFSGAYTGNGSDLPAVSRFYYAKSAIFTVAAMTANQAQFSVYAFTANASGASNVQPLGLVVNTPLATNPADNTLQSNFVNNINNLGTVTYSPLAEGLASIGGYYASSSSHVADTYCQKLFALVVSPGVSSQDRFPASGSVPSFFSDFDGDNGSGGIGEGNIEENDTIYKIPVDLNGSTYLDDVAYYLYNNDIVGYQPGVQSVATYTVGFMGDHASDLFLINTANNGNGNTNLYDTSNPDYGKYFFNAQSPEDLGATLLTAVNSIITRTNSFTAPVVPVTRTTSGNYIYLAFFKPDQSNFWQGNVAKFGLDSNLAIVDANGNPATYPNGAMIDTAKPYWQTTDWATPTASNYIFNANRHIYTYLGTDKDLTASSNAFNTTNMTAALLGNPTHTVAQIVNYIRGADVFDENGNQNTTENRAVITGDVLHSRPVVFQYNATTTYVFYASNDGMLHAVKDSDGTEAWAFIPPDMLPKLKNIVEGVGHQIYLDSSPKIYFKDNNHNGTVDAGDQVILVCGERQGGTGYFALDITNPESPQYLWRINQVDSSPIPPDQVIPMLGQSWSEPQFGVVKTSSTDTVGTPVFFIGGGYISNNSSGKAILAINTLTGQVVKSFTNPDMDYSIPSNVLAIDENDDGFINTVYVGDLGSQVWRVGQFTDASGAALAFPGSDENINDWTAQMLFLSDSSHARQFFYPPSLTMEKGYDLLFIGTGDRVNACSTPTYLDRFYCIKDTHASTTLNETNLVDVTASASLTDTTMDPTDGWFIQLAPGEKVLAENTVFYKVVYFTTFTPTTDPCTPGGDGRIYAMQYKTGASKVDFYNDGSIERSIVIGGGIPSSPVMLITATSNPAKLMVAEGSTNPDASSLSFNAGVVSINPLTPAVNFLYRWWKQILNY